MGTVPKAYLTSMQHSKDEVAYAIRIDINKPILRLYRNGHMWRSYPVALGKPETQTPIGEWEIVDKQKDWGGGFGTRWLGLNVPWGTYGIHGTNRPAFIGTYASNGCIRMHNHDVEQLYDTVPLGTPVIITGNPLKYLRTLAYGHIGADVQQVQRQLKALGYFRGECDGRFDQATQFALELFELAHELPMNGVVDKEDYQALGLIE
ncbi:MAG: L,D-transpeptidase family protein [Alicyclobacillus sp.]|nr:L,D-transpeptidase family protein [Alicyclobacillus sp.]